MGYTHYWTMKRMARPAEWARLVKSVRHVLSTALLTQNFPALQYDEDINEPVEITDKTIRFNGVGNDGHETFLFSRDSPGFNFCKTNEKPYDLAVCIVLLLVNTHCPDAWKIESDGTQDDWEAAMKWLEDNAIPFRNPTFFDSPTDPNKS